ncbi:hypothetical protein ZWY2020_022004 [Hordeum vulgare]|nr:hypothetical protein ZWY2020_022004 [Hordeum vulgare]
MASGGAPDPWRPPLPPPREGHHCYFCKKWWPTAQALGGHMSSRSCLKNSRRNEPVSQPVPNLPALIWTFLGPWLLLAPNPSFWEEYRHGGPPPVEINFMGLPVEINFMGLPVASAPQPVVEPEGNVLELLAAEPEEDGAGEEVNLTLAL